MTWVRSFIILFISVDLFMNIIKDLMVDDESRIGWILFDCIVLTGALTYPG